MTEYEQLSKIQRGGLFSHPVSINLLNNFKEYKQNFRKDFVHGGNKNEPKKAVFSVGAKTHYPVFQSPVFNTINDTYQDPGKLGKFNYQNNRFLER